MRSAASISIPSESPPDDVLTRLSLPRDPATLSLPASMGIYAIYLRPGRQLGSVPPNPDGLLYVGRTKSSLLDRDARTHFATGKTSSSTLRRSLGAILKADLDLTAVARGSGGTRKDATHYRFVAAGEDRLTTWMLDSLLMAVAQTEDPVGAEKTAIQAMRPPLNLTGLKPWVNPQAQHIKALRKLCADEAAASR